jgi:hypothetical protein
MITNPEYRRMVIDTLCQALLGDPDVSNRLDAVKALAIYGENCIPSLCQALVKETNADVRALIIAVLGQLGDDSKISEVSTDTLQSATSTEEKQVFISYAWGGESERITNQIEEAFQAKEITIIRDKKYLKYKESIKEFMQRIGQGTCVIAVISDSYLKSENCMFELLEIAKNRDFYNRIFPLILLTSTFQDMNTFNLDIHVQSEFAEMIEAVAEKLNV